MRGERGETTSHRPLCAVCGVDLTDAEDRWRAADQWFCSPARFAEGRGREAGRARRRRRLAVLLGSAAGVAAFLVWIVANPFAGADPRARPLLAALAAASQDDRSAFAHPLRLHRRLDAAAASVADAYMHAVYVERSCTAATRETRALPQVTVALAGTAIRAPECRYLIHTNAEDDAHLVAGSRRLAHGCDGGSAVPVRADECFEYTTIGRVVTANDTHLPGCYGSTVALYLERFPSGWRVVQGSTPAVWGGPCRAADLRLWARRIAFTHA